MAENATKLVSPPAAPAAAPAPAAPLVPPQPPAPGQVDKAAPGDKSAKFIVAEKHLGHYGNGDKVTRDRLAALGVDDDRLARLVAEGKIVPDEA